ncbi:dimerization domain protein, hAT family, partial [Opisthorchis viverrini]
MIVPLLDNLFRRFDRLLGGISETQNQSAVTSKYDVEYENRNDPPHRQFIRSIRARLLHTYQANEPVSKALTLATVFDPRWDCRYSKDADLVYQYLLEMHPYIGRCGTPKIHSIYSELDRYMREPLLAVDQNPLEWWANKANTFPRLTEFARTYLLFPMSTLLRPSDASVRHSSSTVSPLPTSSRTTNPHAWLDELVQEYEKLDVSEVFAALVQTNRNMPRSLSILSDDVSDYCFLWYNWARTYV